MEINFIDIARGVIAEECKEVVGFKPMYIPIKDNRIKVSTNINSLKKADECMLLLPYVWYNTVPNKYEFGTVTYKNTLFKLIHIDNEGNVSYNGYPKNSLLRIDCDWNFYTKVSLFLKWKNTKLYTCGAEVEDFHRIWIQYQASKRIMDILDKDFDDERAKLQSKIAELTKECCDLNGRYGSRNKSNH